jgi:hypothetical protein
MPVRESKPPHLFFLSINIFYYSFLSFAAQLALRPTMFPPAAIRPSDPSCFFFSTPCRCAAGLARPPHARRVRPKPDSSSCTGCLATQGSTPIKAWPETSKTPCCRPPPAHLAPLISASAAAFQSRRSRESPPSLASRLLPPWTKPARVHQHDC